ncbi:MAG: recombination regulator RecX [bacterium]|nr:recombination regulator RecX [bacterium]
MVAEEENCHKAREVALNYLSYRARSSKEVYERLRRKGFSAQVAEEVISYLTERRYLDDRALAEDLAEFLVNRKLVGRLWLRHELQLRGIAAEIIDQVVKKVYDPEEKEKEVALRLVQKRLRTQKGDREKLRRSLASLLARHGFPHLIIRQVVLEALGRTAAGDESGEDGDYIE